MTNPRRTVTMLGLGTMGHSLAATLLEAGHLVTVWNRTPGRARDLIERGAAAAATVREAVSDSHSVVVCLYDHASVHAVLDPVTDALRGASIVNLTTTTPEEARELSLWAETHELDYLDGAIMATPAMIGTPSAQILYSGSRQTYDFHRPLLNLWANSTYDGADPGAASLLDLAMLSGMYSLFTGFLHGAAMARSGGASAASFAERAAPFLSAMTAGLARKAEMIDRGDYTSPTQSLDWTITALDTISRASRELGVDSLSADVVRSLIRDQIDAGHGAEAFDRIIETMHPRTR